MKEHQYIYCQSGGIVAALTLLAKVVKDQREKGWKPYGSPVYAGQYGNHVWVQPMIQEEGDAIQNSNGE